MDNQKPRVLTSELDASVNFVTYRELGEGAALEARYVRRSDDYFIVYLSSQTGCRKACRFCHLTQTGQTDDTDATIGEILAQADEVLAHYDRLEEPARSVHFNFMARGEVFANDKIRCGRAGELIAGLNEKAITRGLVPRVKLSTIMPTEMADLELAELFAGHCPDIYYSLYSTDPQFRRRWMPKALPVDVALGKLVRYQELTRKIPVLHWAMIEGENDDISTIERICEAVNEAGLRCDFNIVRYNPFSDGQGAEPPVKVLERNAELLRAGVPGSYCKIVGRVGFDVKASCGMFVGGRRRTGGRETAFAA